MFYDTQNESKDMALYKATRYIGHGVIQMRIQEGRTKRMSKALYKSKVKKREAGSRCVCVC
jgi:hypothetical protein